MIHKLYVNIAGWSQLDLDHDKKVVLDTMMYDNIQNKHTYYMIVSEDKNLPPDVDVLRNQEDIDKYIDVFNERQRLSGLSCVELKRDITKNVKIKKKGSRKN